VPAIVRCVLARRPCEVFMCRSLAQDAALQPEKSCEITVNLSRRSRSLRAQNGGMNQKKRRVAAIEARADALGR